MNKMPLNKNLQELMKIHGNLNVTELARLTQIPQPTLHHILSGVTKNPRRNALEILAEFFSISVEQLVGAVPLPPPEMHSLTVRSVPVIEWNLIKNSSYKSALTSSLNKIIADSEIDENSFALIMHDDIMYPQFPKNSILIFNPNKKPKDRDFVIVHHTRDDVINFNRLFIDGNEMYIKKSQENADAQLVKLSSDSDCIIATLAEARLQY